MDRIEKIKAFPEELNRLNHIGFNILQNYEVVLTFAFDTRSKVPIYRSACWFVASFTGIADFELLFH